ncbi:MAG: hypothetical protein ABI868_05065 [Acidobacteriota bacterium]
MSGSNPFAASGRKPAAGDIVVTRRRDGYYIGRVVAGTDDVAAIEMIRERSEALAFACTQVSGGQRVVIHDFAGSRHHVEVPCRQTS